MKCNDEPVSVRPLEIRAATAADRAAILELCAHSLGWNSNEPWPDFFAWKHDKNAFGPSPMWVALDGDRLVGLRTFLRWRFRDATTPDRPVTAVRAVDTATHPEFQGRGIFRLLTMTGVDALTEGGTDSIFNTPNDKSRPGYLKMGWSDVGVVQVAATARPNTAHRVRGARQPAELWSSPTRAGVDPVQSFSDADAWARLLDARRQTTRFATDHTVETLRWRYGLRQLGYRVWMLGDRVEDGAVIFRLRRRGTAREATICETFLPRGTSSHRSIRGRLWPWALAREVGADYLLATAHELGPKDGFVPVPKVGPILTWRPLAWPHVPHLADLGLTLGDVELM